LAPPASAGLGQPLTAQALVTGYRTLINEGKKAGVAVHGGTLLPFQGVGFYQERDPGAGQPVDSVPRRRSTASSTSNARCAIPSTCYVSCPRLTAATACSGAKRDMRRWAMPSTSRPCLTPPNQRPARGARRPGSPGQVVSGGARAPTAWAHRRVPGPAFTGRAVRVVITNTGSATYLASPAVRCWWRLLRGAGLGRA
jgi:hypothetical protein